MTRTTTAAIAKLYDALVLGAGPAGLSTALTLCRVKHTNAVFSISSFRNDPAYRDHTVLSRGELPVAEILRLGRLDIEKYGNLHFVERGAASARKMTVSSKDGNVSGFEVTDDSGGVWRGRKLVLAMGSKDIYPDIPGCDQCWGNTINQCLFCDGSAILFSDPSDAGPLRQHHASDGSARDTHSRNSSDRRPERSYSPSSGISQGP